MPRISGFVTEQFTNRALPGTTIIIDDAITTSGPDGSFSVDVPSGSKLVRAILRAFQEFNTTLTVAQDVQMNITLSPILRPLI